MPATIARLCSGLSVKPERGWGARFAIADGERMRVIRLAEAVDGFDTVIVGAPPLGDGVCEASGITA